MEDVKETCDVSKTEVPNISGSTSSSNDLSMSLPEEAFNNFLQGKRHMLVQDYSFAVQSLGTACEMYVEHYGELAIECGEVYFLYGKALFRLSQQQAGVLGGAINDGSNEDENSSESGSKENEENEENESEKNSDAEGEEEEGEENDEAEGDKEEKEPSESTDSPPAVLDEVSSETNVKDTSKATSEAGPSQQEESADRTSVGADEENRVEEGNEGNQEPDEDDLELAWNTLETAKSIFKRQNTVEAELKVAEIYQLLAEISMESDNNPAAINDLQESLKIQQKHLKPDDRILAETYYQMGLAQMLEKTYPEALENFRTAKQILELRRENLKNTKVDDADGTFKSADIQAEISDLDTILVDIQEKIEDTLELITNKEKEMKEGGFSEAGSSSLSFFEVMEKTVMRPVSNITHLLKRKKPEEGSSDDGTKRIKLSVPNGESKATESKTKIAEG